MTMQDDFTTLFAPDVATPNTQENIESWKVLLVDDDPGIHSVYRLALQGINVEGRSLQFLDAASAREAKTSLMAHSDIALVLLDVVMETGEAGLKLVHHIREEMGNHIIQIILITGQPGHAPLRDVIRSYEINSYLAKSELTADKVFSAVHAALRTHRLLLDMRLQEQQLQLIAMAFTHAHDGIIITDANGLILDANQGFVDITGYSKEEVVGQNPRILKSDKQNSAFYQGMWQALLENGYWNGEICNRRKNGELYIELLTINAVRDANGTNRNYLAFFSDISERKRTQDALHHVHELLDETQRIGKVGGWEFDILTGKQIWTEEVYRIHEVDHDLHPTVEKGLNFYSPPSRPIIELALQQAIEKGEPFNLELEIITAKGHLRNVHVIGKTDLEHHRIYGFFQDITERQRLEEKVRQLAFHDALTDLPNRRLMIDHLNHAMGVSKRTGRYAALIFLDLDNFKPINDTYGHEAGDQLLLEVAKRLRSCVREIDTVSRFGGDEFAVLLSELSIDPVDSANQATTIAEKIRTALEVPCVLVAGQAEAASTAVQHRCTASIGAVIFINHDYRREELFRWADTAMYQAKKDGGNLVRFYKAGGSL
jgi:diguanylate cyclase (GGDEF)-like protein/PAS domain S-box-containing protein